MQLKVDTLGGLTCRQLIPQEKTADPELAFIICHGFGASGEDLIGVGAELIRHNPEFARKVRFAFPEAPLSLDQFGMPGGRAWWPLDVNRLMQSIEQGEFRDLSHDTPPGLVEARGMLHELVEQVAAQNNLPLSKVVLGGFSQGAMITTDLALHLEEPPAALCVWSGTLLCRDKWEVLVKKRGPLKVVQSHGTQDPILPFEAALWLRDMLQESGFDVTFLEFTGDHTIPNMVIERTADLINGLLAPKTA